MNQFKSERIFLREIEITDISKRVIKWFEDELIRIAPDKVYF